jgi:hypothetical protein
MANARPFCAGSSVYDADDDDVAIAHAMPELVDERRLGATRRAPARPEIENERPCRASR